MSQFLASLFLSQLCLKHTGRELVWKTLQTFMQILKLLQTVKGSGFANAVRKKILCPLKVCI